jgi:hypothetical protein
MLDEYFSQFSYKNKMEASYSSIIAFYFFKYAIIFPLSVYNIVFIPLQMAFNYRFTGMYLALEVLTIFAYLVDIGLIARQCLFLKREKKISKHSSDNLGNQSIHYYDKDELEEKLRHSRIDLGLSMVSTVPFSLIFS